jgi:NAD(P)-dependent dehydrogenase (short-subunit alcohol dehydrogenase family)
VTFVSGSAKTALVTGGTDGIGKEVARARAGAGHQVFVVGRDADKGSRAERELRAILSPGRLRRR